MSEFAQGLRSFVYTIICMECLLQISSGNSYHRYMKLFTYILIVCLSCRMIFAVVNQIEEKSQTMEVMYEEWLEEWEEMGAVINE